MTNNTAVRAGNTNRTLARDQLRNTPNTPNTRQAPNNTNSFGGKTGRPLVESMKQDIKQAQGGDPAALQRLEELAKQNKALFKKFEQLMNGGQPGVDPTVNPNVGPQPNPDPGGGPQPAPNPTPDPGGGGGGCSTGNCGGGGGAGAAGGAGGAAGGGIMEFLTMILQMLMQAKQGGGDQAAAGGGGQAGPAAPGGGGGGGGGLGAGQAEGAMKFIADMLGIDPTQLEQMFQQDPQKAVDAIAQAAQAKGIDLKGQLGGLVPGQ